MNDATTSRAADARQPITIKGANIPPCLKLYRITYQVDDLVVACSPEHAVSVWLAADGGNYEILRVDRVTSDKGIQRRWSCVGAPSVPPGYNLTLGELIDAGVLTNGACVDAPPTSQPKKRARTKALKRVG